MLLSFFFDYHKGSGASLCWECKKVVFVEFNTLMSPYHLKWFFLVNDWIRKRLSKSSYINGLRFPFVDEYWEKEHHVTYFFEWIWAHRSFFYAFIAPIFSLRDKKITLNYNHLTQFSSTLKTDSILFNFFTSFVNVI